VEDSWDCHVHKDKMYCWSWEGGVLEADVRHVAKFLAAIVIIHGIIDLTIGKNI
jgi:hypothetical protein